MQRCPDRKTSSEIQTFRRALRVLEREIFRQLEGETSCCGVTLSQCHVLLELAAADLSLTALARNLDLDKSTLSRTVEALVGLGLVQRRADKADRRTSRLMLTPRGRERVATIDGQCDHFYGALLRQMTPGARRETVRAVERLAGEMRRLRDGEPARTTCAPGTGGRADRARTGRTARTRREA